MPTRIENYVTGVGQVLTQLAGMGKRSSEQLELAYLTRRFRNGFNQMRDRMEAPAEKSFRSSNPSGDNRRQLNRPFPFIIIGALVAVGLAVDIGLIINAGGIPGVLTLPGITQTATTKVNKVATKVAAVVEVVDDLAGDEEEYIIEDEASGDYEDDLPSLPVLDFSESGEEPEKTDEPLLAADEGEEETPPGTEEPAAAVAEEATTEAVVAEEATTTTEEEPEVVASTSTAPETTSKAVEEVEGTDTRQDDEEEKEARFHKYYDDKEEGVDFLDAGEWFNAE